MGADLIPPVILGFVKCVVCLPKQLFSGVVLPGNPAGDAYTHSEKKLVLPGANA
jgi:hypothetical protein